MAGRVGDDVEEAVDLAGGDETAVAVDEHPGPVVGQAARQDGVEVIGRMAPDLSGWTLSWTSLKRQSPLPPPNMISSQLGTDGAAALLGGLRLRLRPAASAAASRSGSGARSSRSSRPVLLASRSSSR